MHNSYTLSYTTSAAKDIHSRAYEQHCISDFGSAFVQFDVSLLHYRSTILEAILQIIFPYLFNAGRIKLQAKQKHVSPNSVPTIAINVLLNNYDRMGFMLRT